MARIYGNYLEQKSSFTWDCRIRLEHQPAWLPLHCLDHQNDFRDAMCKCSIRYFHIPIIHLVYPSSPSPPPQKKIVSISIVSSFSWDLQSSQENLKTIFIRHLHIPHNAHYLTPKISRSLCFSFLVDITAIPRETENNAYVRFWGANKVYYGGCASGKCNIFGDKQGVLWLMWK